MLRRRIVTGVVAIGLLSASHGGLGAQAASDSTVPVSPNIRALARSVGASIATIDSLEITDAHATTLSELLEARLPGVSVLRHGGAAADGSRVQARGTTSFLANTSPIVLVDGARIDARQDVVLLDHPTHSSRLDDIPPEDVARIDVLRGAAAASLFGPGAGAGVIVVTTKRGAPGPLRMHVFGDAGMSTNAVRFPANYYMRGIQTATGQPALSCSNVDVAVGACTPTSLQIWNPLGQASLLRTGHVVDGGASLARGTRNTSLAASVGAHRDEGVAPSDELRRLSARGNVTQRLFDRLELAAHVGYVDRRDGLEAGVLGAGLFSSELPWFGPPISDSTHRYGLISAPGKIHGEHFTGSASLQWRILSWLSASVTEGRDHSRQFADGVPPGVLASSGWISSGWDVSRTSTFDASLAAEYGANARVAARTVAGYEELGVSRVSYHMNSISGTPTSSEERYGRAGSRALWLRQNLAWADRLVLNTGLRRNTADPMLGHQSSAWYPSADLSLLVPKRMLGSSLRLRTAYGETGAAPFSDLSLVSAINPVRPYLGVPSVPLTPERVTEYEFGVDAAWGERVSLHLTHFNAVSSHLWRLLTSLYFGSSLASVGRMTNAGTEIATHVHLINRPAARWNASISLATLTNRVVSVDNLRYSSFFDRTALRPGFPFAGYWALPYTYSDRDHNGLITPNEITYGSAPVYLGTPIPTVESSIRSSVDLRSGLSVSAAVDYRGGQKAVDWNEEVRCYVENCRGVQDPSASLADQARAVALFQQTLVGRVQPYLQDAAFAKLREVRVTWTLPAPLAHGLGTRDAAVSVSGRDLATWTRFRGLDPEVTGSVNRFGFPFAWLPVPRRFILRVDVSR